MYLVVGKLLLGAFLLAFLGCSSISVPASKPEPERKWVPYPIGEAIITPGIPAFVLILETKETACARQKNRFECYRHWEELPKGFRRIEEDEVSYLHDYGDGFQQVRLSRLSFCAMVQEMIDEEYSCQDLWRAFSRKKMRENI